ncbi:unnamed protein product [Dovyalis caffra]|uniref:Uncharacterized protein n=1 Tax=Dovyalis caffra TaxID=77055 RepID=A0AAV1QNK6_9ROSI|nr:unnamed protein product [Dovyalis caffra]
MALRVEKLTSSLVDVTSNECHLKLLEYLEVKLKNRTDDNTARKIKINSLEFANVFACSGGFRVWTMP